MESEAWYCEEADEDGFVDVPFLRERARRGRESFREDFPRPGLYVRAQPGGDDRSEAVDRGRSGVQLLTTALKSVAALKYLGRVAFVAKRPGNPFAHLISVGRSERNDITIAVDSISKVHGYFTPSDGDGWAFNDHGSTNGSFLGDEKLEPGEKTDLASGDLLRLGVEVTLEILSPDELFDRVLG